MITELLLIGFVILSGLAGFYFGHRRAEIRFLGEKRKLMLKLAKIRHDAAVSGLDQASALWGKTIARIHGADLYGFARCCDACGETAALCVPKSLEYYRCRSCGHRNPTPNPETRHGVPS